MDVRQLKEAALALYSRREFAECARTYEQLLTLEPRDPHLYMRHADACRRAGDRWRAIASYRTAAELLRRLGCDARAREALKVALELNPRDAELQRALDRMTPASMTLVEEHAPEEEPPSRRFTERPRYRESTPSPGTLRQVHPAAPASSGAEVRRLSENTVAIRTAPGTRWWVVSSSAPLTAYEVEDVDRIAMPSAFSPEPGL